MQSLTSDQLGVLVELITEKYGSELDYQKFADIALGLLEDIAGFETISQQTANRYVKVLWVRYQTK